MSPIAAQLPLLNAEIGTECSPARRDLEIAPAAQGTPVGTTSQGRRVRPSAGHCPSGAHGRIPVVASIWRVTCSNRSSTIFRPHTGVNELSNFQYRRWRSTRSHLEKNSRHPTCPCKICPAGGRLNQSRSPIPADKSLRGTLKALRGFRPSGSHSASGFPVSRRNKAIEAGRAPCAATIL